MIRTTQTRKKKALSYTVKPTELKRRYRINLITGPEIKNGYVSYESNCKDTFRWRKDYTGSSISNQDDPSDDKIKLDDMIEKHDRASYTKTMIGEWDFINKEEAGKREGFYIKKLKTLNPNGINYYDPSKSPGFNMTGTHHFEETKEKIRKKQKKFLKTEKGKEKRRRDSESLSNGTHPIHSPEARAKATLKTTPKTSVPVQRCDEEGNVLQDYPSMRATARAIEGDVGCIRYACHNGNTYLGYHWKLAASEGRKSKLLKSYDPTYLKRGMETLALRLRRRNASDKEIEAAFIIAYKVKGIVDITFIRVRIAVYIKIADKYIAWKNKQNKQVA